MENNHPSNEENTTGDPKSFLKISLNKISRERLERLFERTPDLTEWPMFRIFFEMYKTPGKKITICPDELDALLTTAQFLRNEPQLHVDHFDTVMDTIINKMRKANGKDYDHRKMPDLIYEANVALLLKSRYRDSTFSLDIAPNEPDCTFRVNYLHEPSEIVIAIECKNVRTQFRNIKNLVRSVSQAIKEAIVQHKGRGNSYADLIIFVDLPLDIFCLNQPDYYKLVVNVMRELHLSGFENIDEIQIIYTASSQKDMSDYIYNSEFVVPDELFVFPPHTVGKVEVNVAATRMLFLSFLFRKFDEPANCYNWSKRAVSITNPDQYLID